MSTVVGVRVPKELKEELERLGIDYSEEVRRRLEEMVRRRKAGEAVKALRQFRASIGEVKGDVSAEIIREARNRR